MNNNQSSVPRPQRSREGSLNPMWGKEQSQETKEKISNSQKARYEAIRQALYSEDAKNEPIGRTDTAAKMDLLNQCLHRDTIEFDSVQQAYNFVAIMLENKGNYIRNIIKEELNKLLKDKDRHAQ